MSVLKLIGEMIVGNTLIALVILLACAAMLSTAMFFVFLVPGTFTWTEMTWYERTFILAAPVSCTVLSVIYRIMNGEWPK